MVAERRDEPERRRLEQDLHGRCIDRLGPVVGLREQANRVDAFILAPGVPDVEIGDDGRRIERCAIGESHAFLEVQGELGGVAALFPALGDPGTDLAVGIDIDELVGHVAPDVALEAGDRAVVRNPGATERVDEEGNVAAIRRSACTSRRRQARHCRQGDGCHHGGRGQQATPGEQERREVRGHG